jgi:purine-binding chemotaxis protein CheW
MKSASVKDKNKASVEDSTQIVTFQVGGEEYGLDIKSITEVIRPLKITPLPKMPEFVEGVINLRGVIIPIVDLRKRFSLLQTAGNPRTMRMVITKGAFASDPGRGKELLGLLVDLVNEVLHVPRKDIELAPTAATGQHAEFITGMGKVGDRLIIFLDISRILNRQERAALTEAGKEEGKSGT